MPGMFNVPGAGIEGASLDEIIAAASKDGGKSSMRDVIADAARPLVGDGSSKLLKRLADIAETRYPELFNILGSDCLPILRSNLEINSAEKIANVLKFFPPEKARALLREAQRRISTDRAHAKNESADLDRELVRLRNVENAWIDVGAWLGGRLALGRANGSMLHKFVDALDTRPLERVFWMGRESAVADRPTVDAFRGAVLSAEVFVVQHDWAAAFSGATDYAGGELRMPAERCAFEFHISGRRVIGLVEDGHLCPIVSTPEGWIVGELISVTADLENPNGESYHLDRIPIDQIRAIAIALDAEVAASDVVRAPHKLNHARERSGKHPLFSYHVVRLDRRSRAPRLPETDGHDPGTRRRLHFRRGHWRHYETHKTWIKWMLVGDPDLGFVDKEYRL